MPNPKLERPEPVPDVFVTPLFCYDLPMEGDHMIRHLEEIIRIFGRGTHGLAGIQTDNLVLDDGEEVSNHRRNRCRFIFKKLQ